MDQLVFAVTNELNYDQRMIRICSSLANAGYHVLLLGRRNLHSSPLQNKNFRQKRLLCFFRKGKAAYLEYNLKLFFYLLFKRIQLICAIDLDTILPCYWVSVLKKVTRVYDAHELFCEMKEVKSRPRIYKIWKKIERYTVPEFKNGYTVTQEIANEFKSMYGVDYAVIRNVPLLSPVNSVSENEKYFIYQGAVNEGRCFEILLPAMRNVSAKLTICGTGNFMDQAKRIARENNLENKIIFQGNIFPDELLKITSNAWAGITLFENSGLSNYYSLANRFFDYINAGIPQLCVDFPAYRKINEQYNIALMIGELTGQSVSDHLNRLLSDENLYRQLQQNCLRAREELNWQTEEKKLLSFYRKLTEANG